MTLTFNQLILKKITEALRQDTCPYCEQSATLCICATQKNDVREADEFYADLKARLDERSPA